MNVADKADELAAEFNELGVDTKAKQAVVAKIKLVAEVDPVAGVALALRTYSYLANKDERSRFMRMMTTGVRLPLV